MAAIADHPTLDRERSQPRKPGWFALINRDTPNAYHFLLALRFGLINLCALAALGLALAQGWVQRILLSDSTYLIALIVLTFLTGLALCTQKIIRISVELNRSRAQVYGQPSRLNRYLDDIDGKDSGSRALLAHSLKLRLSARIGTVRHIANTLVLLGLIGTVLGFIIALAGVDPETANDPSSIAPMVASLIDGMGVALHTTLVGSVLNIWLMANYRLLEGGTVNLFNSIVEEGERRARV